MQLAAPRPAPGLTHLAPRVPVWLFGAVLLREPARDPYLHGMETAGAPSGRLWTPTFIRLSVMDLAYFLASGVLLYALPLYAVGPVGSNELGAGLAFGAFTFSAILLRPMAGRVSDRYGRRLPLLAGALLATACSLGLLLAHAIVTVVGLRLVMGVAEAAFFVAGFAALADIAPVGRTAEALSFNSLSLYLGLALGPLLGHALVSSSGYPGAWWGAAGLGAIAVGLAWTFPDPPRAPELDDAEPVPLIHRPTLAPALGFLGGMMASAGFMAFSGIRAQELGMSNPSIVLFTYAGVVVLGRVVLARRADLYPPLHLLVVSLVVIALGVALGAVATSGAALVVAGAVTGLGVTLLTPAFFAAVFARTSARERGAAAGTASMFIDLGLGVGPFLLGVVAAAQGIPFAHVVGAAVAALAAVWTLRLIRSRAVAG
jgi:MFS family permease